MTNNVALLPTIEKKTPYETIHKTRYMANSRVWYDNYGASITNMASYTIVK